MTDEPEFEELEHIPWAALAATRPDPRLRMGAIAIAGVVAVGAGLLVVNMLLSGGEVTAPPTTEIPQVPMLPSTTTLALVDVAQPVSEGVLPAASTYSEADLMLISVDDEERLAVMHAEWLVRDYLTVDGDDSISDRISALVPETAPSPTEHVSSYVEWVRAFSVGSPSPGDYRVEVVYRVLAGGDEGFVREPVGAVIVDLSIDVDGSARLLAVPEPVAVPELLAMESPPD